MYAISYIPFGGDFAGQECAFWQSYGVPFQFPTVQAASEKLASIPWMRDVDGKVVPWKHAEHLTVEMVEVYSGRRKVEGFRRVVVDESKSDYQRVMGHLTNKFPVEIKMRSNIKPRVVPQKRRIERAGASSPCDKIVLESCEEIL
jgi:hypothetical protein